jgi:two-component system, NtrC family, sensor histidine kinase HydH
MFRVQLSETGKTYRIAIAGLLLLSAAALAVTIWVMIDFLREQEIVQELIQKLPSDATASAEALAGELKWQFRLTILVVLNLVVTGFVVVLLSRAYRSSQQSLRNVKALAGDILSSMDQAVITTDLDGNVTSINKRGLELLSPESECVGRPLTELSNVVLLGRFREDWQTVESIDLTRDFNATQNGSVRKLQASCQTLSNYEGSEIGNVLQLRDITEHVLVNDRLRRMERYMGLGSLAAGLHHEIKNPLAALSLHVQLLEEQIDEDEASDEVHEMLGIIKTEVTRVGAVLEGFQNFASIDRLNVSDIDVRELIQCQVGLVKPRAVRQNIELKVRPADDSIPKILGDRVRLEQVILNLLVNAIEAMSDGGTLTIGTASLLDCIKIDVRDTGCGIPADLRDRVFDPYFTTKSHGTGLGLALCDKIMRQHHGRLEFHTTKSGTTFEMHLPIHVEPVKPINHG